MGSPLLRLLLVLSDGLLWLHRLLLDGLLLLHGLLHGLLLNGLLLPLKNRLLLLKYLLLLLKDLLLLGKLFLLHGALLLLLLLVLLLRGLSLFLLRGLLLLLFLLLAPAVRSRRRPLADSAAGARSGPAADGRPDDGSSWTAHRRASSRACHCTPQSTDPRAGALSGCAFRFLARVRRTTGKPRCGDAHRQRYRTHFHEYFLHHVAIHKTTCSGCACFGRAPRWGRTARRLVSAAMVFP